MNRKLLYILPEYDAEAHTHFSYIPPFLAEVGKDFSITLLVERGHVSQLPGVSKIIRMPRMRVLRALMLPLRIFIARMRGTKVAYVHYSFMSAFWASLIFRATGGSVFYWNCGLPWQYSRSYIRDISERTVYLMVSYVVTGTEKLADWYAEEYALPRRKVLVMPNWIDIEETAHIAFMKNESTLRNQYHIPSGPYVLFAHRLSERKGAQYLPEIYSQMPTTATLVIAGDGPLRESLEKKTVGEGGAENVRFLGWVPHDDVIRLMSYATCYLMPSDEEGFPHVLLEAMALGTPFVATSVGGVPEIVPPRLQGDLHPKGNVANMASDVARFLFHGENERGIFRDETHDWVAQYDVKLVARRFEAILAPCYSPRQ